MYLHLPLVWILLLVLFVVVESENVCPEGQKLCVEGCVSIEHKCERELCPYPKIECKDRRKCYEKEQQCDKVYDCLDRSDEQGCGRTTPSPYYFDANRTEDTGPKKKRTIMSLDYWLGVLLITIIVIIATVLLAGFCIYWVLKCRLLHDQIAYDEKHKFMEEHGEMPSSGPIISGIKPPQDGWKYVTKSAYMMMLENESTASPTEEAETNLMNNVKEVPKVITTDTITETDEKEEEEVSPGSPNPPGYEEALKLAPEPEDANEIVKEESGEEENTSDA